jgi:hypothetical protein
MKEENRVNYSLLIQREQDLLEQGGDPSILLNIFK